MVTHEDLPDARTMNGRPVYHYPRRSRTGAAKATGQPVRGDPVHQDVQIQEERRGPLGIVNTFGADHRPLVRPTPTRPPSATSMWTAAGAEAAHSHLARVLAPRPEAGGATGEGAPGTDSLLTRATARPSRGLAGHRQDLRLQYARHRAALRPSRTPVARSEGGARGPARGRCAPMASSWPP
jgi:leucyl-tRNA synthetase